MAFQISALLAVAGLFASPASVLGNTEDDIKNGQFDLTLAATYVGGLPTANSDVTFTANPYSPAIFTITSNLAYGTLNDLSSTALTIQNGTAGNTSTLTLNGGINAVAPSNGGNAGDLLYVGSGSSLTIQNGAAGTLNLALAASGNFNVAGTATISSVISGTGFGITKTGAGTLNLSGANTYSGGTTVSGGTFNIGTSSVAAAGVISSGATGTGNVTLNGGVSVSNSAGTSLFTPTLTIGGTVNLTGVNRLTVGFNTLDLGNAQRTVNVNGKSFTVTGGNTLASETTGLAQWEVGNITGGPTLGIQNGTLDLETTNAAFGGSVNGNYAAFRFNTAANYTNANVIVGANVLLTGRLGNTGAAAPNLTVTAGGIYNMTNSSNNVFSLSGGGSIFNSMLTTNTVGNALSITGTTGTTTFAGTLSNGPGTGALSVAKTTGASTQVFSGTTSTYTGATSVTNGTLRGTSVNAFGNTSGISVGSAGTLDLRADANATFGRTTGGAAYPLSVSASGATFNVDQNTAAGTGQTITVGALTIGSVATPANTIFTGANNTSLSVGAVTDTTAVAGTVSFTNNIAGGGGLTLASFTGTRTGAPTLTFNGSGATSVSGAIAQAAGATQALTYSGTGGLTLNGASTYTGATTVSSGTLTIGATGVVGSGGGTAIAVSGTGTLTDNSTVATTGGITGTSSLAVSAGTATLNGANNYTGATTLSGTGTLNVNNAAAVGGSSGLLLNGGTINNASAAAITLSSATPVTVGGNFVFGGTRDLNLGSGAVSITGNNRVVTLGGANSTLTFGGAATNTLPSSIAFTANGAGNTLVFNNGFNIATNSTTTATDTFGGSANVVINGAITNDAGVSTQNNRVAYNGTGSLTLNSGASTYTGTTTVAAGTIIATASSTPTTGTVTSGPIGTANFALQPTASSPTDAIFALGAPGSAGGLTIANTATVVGVASSPNTVIAGLNTSGNNTFNGTVQIGTSNNLQTTLTVAAAAGGTTTFARTLSNGGTAVNNVVVGNANVAGTIYGGGTVVFSASNTYLGSTTISSGNLRLANPSTGSATGLGQVNLSGGTGVTLSGTGYSSGLLNVTGGSRIAPGANTVDADASGRVNFGNSGTLTLGNNTANGITLTNARLDFDLSAIGGTATNLANDHLATAGALTLGIVGFTFNELGGSLDMGSAYTLISGATSFTGFDPANFTTAFVNGDVYTPNYSFVGNDLTVSFTAAVPEPSSWGLIFGGFGLLFCVNRFRRQSASQSC